MWWSGPLACHVGIRADILWADTNVQKCRHECRHGRPEAHSTSATKTKWHRAILGAPLLRVQMDRLDECAIAGGIPGGETDPFLPGGIDRDPEDMRAERRIAGSGDDLAIDFLAVAPDHLQKFQRISPLELRDDRTSRA